MWTRLLLKVIKTFYFQELITHPKKPSEVRIEDLKIPYNGETMEFLDSNGETMPPEVR